MHGAVDDFIAAFAKGGIERVRESIYSEMGEDKERSVMKDAGRIGSMNTLMAYSSDVHHLCSYLMQRQIFSWSSVTSEHIADYLQALRGEHSYSEKTVARKLSAMRAFFRYMHSEHAIALDPSRYVRPLPVENQPQQLLSSEQIANLFQQMASDTLTGLRDLAMCHVLYASGMHTSELVALNVCHFDQRRLLIHRPGQDKAGRRERDYALSIASARVLATYIEQARPGFVRSIQEEALFLNHHGTRLTRQGFWLIMRGHALRAGIVHLSPHILRISLTALRVERKMHPDTIEALLAGG